MFARLRRIFGRKPAPVKTATDERADAIAAGRESAIAWQAKVDAYNAKVAADNAAYAEAKPARVAKIMAELLSHSAVSHAIAHSEYTPAARAVIMGR